MKFYVLTLFPEMILQGLSHSVLKRALEGGVIEIHCVNIRDFSKNKHKQVDDYPYGGGAGMVLMPDCVYDAYLYAKEISGTSRVIHLSPKGKPFRQKTAEEFSRCGNVILLCGHYEGIDERVLEEIVTDEVSVGDYILTGGELAAMILIDATARLVPGVLNNHASQLDESFSNGLLEYPQYTRPEIFRGKPVPEVLLSGHHKNIEIWRREQALNVTKQKRPDMIDALENAKHSRNIQ